MRLALMQNSSGKNVHRLIWPLWWKRWPTSPERLNMAATIRLTAGRGEDGSAWVTVEDQGPGIPADNLESIFQRFYTERPAEEAFGRHSGLGLSISKQIVDAHGGSIYAENIGEAESPDGARFVLRLPS